MIMDTATTMNNEWIPSKVMRDRELPSMLDAPFASVKQENYFNGEIGKQEIQRKTEERAKTSITCSIDGSTENKTAVTMKRPSSGISPMRINHRAQIDIVDMREEQSAVYNHLLIYEEQYSKLVILRALKTKEAKEVAVELADIVTTIGAPRIIQSGDGRVYAEQVVREIRVLLRDFCVVHGDATKNLDDKRDFKRALKTWMTKNPEKEWQDGLKIVQVLENTTANSRFGKVPSQLFFGRNICEDLRRTIGGKVSMGNFVTDAISPLRNVREQTPNHLSDIDSATRIAETADYDNPADDNGSRNVDRKTNSVETNANDDNSNISSIESESSVARKNLAIDDSQKINNINVEKDDFQCEVCHKQYVKLGHLKNHMKTHTRIGHFECVICCKSFRLSSLYEKHVQKYHEEHNENEISKTRDHLNNCDNDDADSFEYAKIGSKISERMDIKITSILPDGPTKSPSSLISIRNSGKKSLRSNRSTRRKLDKSSTKLNRNPRLECTFCKQNFNFPSVLKRHMRSHTNERPYVCQICNKSFKQLGHLSQHGLTHTDYRSFNCTICAIKFETHDLLNIHAQSHKDGTLCRTKETYRLFECDSCKKIFTTKSVLERHIFTHTHERQYGCKVCGKRFKQAGHVKSHMLVHTGERKFECKICSKRFSLSNSLKKHMYVHNGEKPYQCDVCGSRFLEKRNLNGHLMTHTNERPFSCKICGKRYTLADTLRRHVSAAHEDGRTYQCEICAKMFKQLAHLSVHKKVHNDDRPFQCHLCDKNFKHKNVLKSHLAIHANVRPFECDLCKSTFVRKTNLQTHIASAHMNERPYVCTICNKRFKQISHLNGHIVVHSNSMPYQCDFCDRRCNRLDNLKKHMRLHSRNKD